jgi:hypothetical protein
MALPIIAAGVGIAAAARAIKKAMDSGFYIQNKRGLYYGGLDEKRFLFIKWTSPQWVAFQDIAEEFSDIDEANDCIRENKLRGAMVISKN